MMRAIKFRGKTLQSKVMEARTGIKNGTWVYGYYWSNHDRHFIKIVDDIVWPESNCVMIDEHGFIFLVIEVDEDTVGQFTGKKDTYRNEIYEDDKLRDDDEVGVVIWNNDDGTFEWYSNNICYSFGDIYFGDIYCVTFEVIGNIHDEEEE